VSSQWARSRAAERIQRLCEESRDEHALRPAVLDAIRDVVDFGAYGWLLTDPVTTVGTAPFAEVPSMSELPALVRAKYLTPLNRWTSLTRDEPVALLHATTNGALASSLVWRVVMSRFGICDVASVVFSDQFGCWGFLDLWRDDQHAPFDADDARFLTTIAPTVASGLRDAQGRTFLEPASPKRRGNGPVVLTLDDDLTILGRTASSQEWLDILLPSAPGMHPIPAAVYNVAAQLLAVEAGVDGHAPYSRVHLTDGYWLTLRAARIIGPPEGAGTGHAGIVVTIEEASAIDRMELFSLAVGLSPRERQVMDSLARGSDTRSIARQMGLTENTVQDHLKSIFAKTSAHDRMTLLSRALGTKSATDL
jgi:DNA-binding CsgD family transcriptional regulator